jgi:hypothetical protein
MTCIRLGWFVLIVLSAPVLHGAEAEVSVMSSTADDVQVCLLARDGILTRINNDYSAKFQESLALIPESADTPEILAQEIIVRVVAAVREQVGLIAVLARNIAKITDMGLPVHSAEGEGLCKDIGVIIDGLAGTLKVQSLTLGVSIKKCVFARFINDREQHQACFAIIDSRLRRFVPEEGATGLDKILSDCLTVIADYVTSGAPTW